MNLEEKIIELRKNRLSIKKISEKLKCSRSTASKWFTRNGLSDIGLKKYKELTDVEIIELKEYYKTHTKKETSLKFGVSETTVIKHSDRKMVNIDTKGNARKYKLKRREVMKQKSVVYKGGKCVKCGYNKCIQALEFHHIDSNNKSFSISGNYNISWERIKNELNKCILICANCHRELHATW